MNILDIKNLMKYLLNCLPLDWGLAGKISGNFKGQESDFEKVPASPLPQKKKISGKWTINLCQLPYKTSKQAGNWIYRIKLFARY